MLTRRGVLGLAGGSLAGGLAGCLEDMSPGAGGPAGTSGDGQTTSGDPGETSTEGGATPTGESGCGALSSSLTGYDAAGTPLVFAVDYSDSWRVRYELDEQNPGRYRLIFAGPEQEVEDTTGGWAFEYRQLYDPIGGSVDAAVQETEDANNVDVEVVDELSYDGETVRVFGKPGFPEAGNYRLFWLPHGGQRYPVEFYATTTLATDDGEGNVKLLCADAVRSEADRVFDTVRPNPDSTIGSK